MGTTVPLSTEKGTHTGSSNTPAGVQLILRVLCEGYPNGVPQAIHEQGANAYRRLQPTILTLTSLHDNVHAYVKR